jgi:hypothetical protein
MPRIGFEPTIKSSERAKTVHILDRSATVTGILRYTPTQIESSSLNSIRMDYQNRENFSGTDSIVLVFTCLILASILFELRDAWAGRCSGLIGLGRRTKIIENPDQFWILIRRTTCGFMHPLPHTPPWRSS